MKGFQLKNIIILILVLTNVCLVSILASRQQSRTATQNQAAQELVALFESQGVSLDVDAIVWDNPLPQLTLGKDDSLDDAVVEDVLGTTVSRTDRGGGVTQYDSVYGVAYLRANGSFDVEGTLCSSDYSAFITSFCQEYGYEKIVDTVENGQGSVTAAATYRGLAVQNATVRFDIANDGVVSMAGTLLPQTYLTTTSTASTSALTALNRFLTQRRTTGAVVSAVLEVYSCYEFQTTTTQPMALVPLWCIETDNGTYYINATTGIVTLD